MLADALINDLMAIHPKGFDLSLGRIEKLLEKLGNPQTTIPPAIHVAGTNGKGSTIAFCRALLEAHGKSVHVHTSPHLVNWHERFRLGSKNQNGGTLVSDPVLADAIKRVADANEGKAITVFEILSAVMFVLFSEHEADYSLIEVGLGGRFDATNVISQPLCSVITPVALDHKAFLGDTIEKIAFEKAGIIKRGLPVIIGNQQDEARQVIEERADKLKAPASFFNQDFTFEEERGRFVFQDTVGLLDLPMPALEGAHQLQNASLALAALRSAGIELNEADCERAMLEVQWPGRMQKLAIGKLVEQFSHGTDIWLDGGHNPHAGEAVAKTLRSKMKKDEKVIMVSAMLDTKEPDDYFKAFEDLVDRVITVPVTSSDAGIEPGKLAKIVDGVGISAIATQSLEQGVSLAVEHAKQKNRQTILFAGSLYLVGDVLALNQTPPV